jgi:hypothetical protein
VSFRDPLADIGYAGSGADQVELNVASIGGSTATTGWQYAQVHLQVYYYCATGWCSGGATDWYTPWFTSGQTITPQQRPSVGVPRQDPSGRYYYYTYYAQTTWYDANRTVIGWERYYPTGGTVTPFTHGADTFYGSHDFACVGYAHNNHYCSFVGPVAASFSPTGQLYTLKAGW